MAALELLTGFVTAPGATQTPLTMAAGNSLTIRNAPADTEIRLLTTWVDKQGAGTLRIRSPLIHDNNQGIRFDDVVSQVLPLFPPGYSQKLKTQDTLVVDLSGSATAGDIETACLLIWYATLPGVDARFVAPADVKGKMKNIVTVQNTIALGTAGGYSGQEAINAETDLLHGNTDYALLGYVTDVECAAVRFTGTEWGNLGIGGPGAEDHPEITSGWFVYLSEMFGMPLIPVFNSANKTSFLIDGAQDENGADITLSTVLAEL